MFRAMKALIVSSAVLGGSLFASDANAQGWGISFYNGMPGGYYNSYGGYGGYGGGYNAYYGGPSYYRSYYPSYYGGYGGYGGGYGGYRGGHHHHCR